MMIKKLTAVSAAILVLALSGVVYAEDNVQARSQDQTRSQLDLQLPESDSGQAVNRNSAQKKVQNNYQHRNQYQYRNKYQSGSGNADDTLQSNQGSMNRSMQGGSVTGAMSRQSSGSRSAGGGRR